MYSPKCAQLDKEKSRQCVAFSIPTSMTLYSATYTPQYTPLLSFSSLGPASKVVSEHHTLAKSFQPVAKPARAYGSPPATPLALSNNPDTPLPYFWEPTVIEMDDYAACQCPHDSDVTQLDQQGSAYPSRNLNSPQAYNCIRYAARPVDTTPLANVMSALPESLGTEMIGLSHWQEWQNETRRSDAYDSSTGPNSRRASHTIPSSATSKALTQPPSPPDMPYPNPYDGRTSRPAHEAYHNYAAHLAQPQPAEPIAGNEATNFPPQLTATARAIPTQYTISALDPQYMETTEEVPDVGTVRSETSLFEPTSHPTSQQFASSRTSAESSGLQECHSNAPEINNTHVFTDALFRLRFDHNSPASVNQAVKTYQAQIVSIFLLVHRGDLYTAGTQLLRISQHVLGDLEALGFLRDDANHLQQQIKFWDTLNLAWLVMLQSEFDNLQTIIQTQQQPLCLPGSIMDGPMLEGLGRELIHMCDSLAPWGIIDYQMGIAEEDIINLLIRCLELLKPSPDSM